jgi:hypothetical protein
MHPILASGRLMLFYVTAWVCVLGLLVFITSPAAGVDWRAAAATLAPACAVYAFVCLSPWYMNRALPLRVANLSRAAASWSAAAAVAGGIFAGVAAAFGAAVKFRPYLPMFFGMGALIFLVSTGLHYAARAGAEQRAAEARAAEARLLARDSELQALKFQLNPHFLFNSLHSIAALATMDGVRARDMCVRLSDFLRSSLRLGDRESIPLREELALARSYLEVERVRFGARLRVEEGIDSECEECLVPALLLQPLVENAVTHGIAGLVEGGAIRLAARHAGGGVAIEIENEFDPQSPPPRAGGIGLAHVRRRLAVRYGDEAQLDAAGSGGVYRVVLRLPCESPMASSSRA